MEVIYGVNPLLEALKSNEGGIRNLVVAKGREGEGIRKILALAAEKQIPVVFRMREELDRLTGGMVHQGILGIRREFHYASVEEIVAHRPEGAGGDLVVLLDGITDPQNLGAIIRTGHCFGVNGFIIPGNRSASLTAAVMKASSGALQYTPVAVAVNLVRIIDFLKEQGFWIYGADADGDPNPRVFDGVKRLALVMGSEGKGIRPLVRKKCDFFVSIPMKGKIDSLNVSVAAGILIHQIVKKWDEK